MRERLSMESKDPIGCQQAQDAAEGIRISTHCPRQVGGRARGLVEYVSHSELGNNVQTAWQRIATCQIQ